MAATYTPIASITLGAATDSVTFSSIPQTYTDLVLITNCRITSGTNYIRLNYNYDTGSNYSRTVISGNGSTASSFRVTNEVTNFPNNFELTTAANTFDTIIINIMNYSNTTTNKTILSRGTATGLGTSNNVGLWRNTAAISTIAITTTGSTFTLGSTFNLYGILAGNA
jgi:hypothetical protein